MGKFELLFLIFFIQALLQVSSLPPKGDKNIVVFEDYENQFQLEEDIISSNVFEKTASCCSCILVYPIGFKFFYPKLKHSNNQNALIHGIRQSNLVFAGISFFGSACYRIINIPLYLHTEHFLI